MKMRKILILAMAVLLLTGCGDSTSEGETRTDTDMESTEVIKTDIADDTVETEKSAAQGDAEYIGTFGEDVFFTGIEKYVGCEFDITMIYEAKDTDGNYVFEAVEKTAEGSMVGLFRVADKTEGKLLAETENYNSLDNLAVEMRVVLDDFVIYEEEGTGEISIEYEVSAEEAIFLPLDSVEAKLARSGYFVAGNTINFKSGLSIHVLSTGHTNILGMNCVYVEIEAVNNGEEEVYLPDPNFYGDDYILERAYMGDNTDIMSGMGLAPGRKVQGYYCANIGYDDYSVIEAELHDAIVMVQYSTSAAADLSIYGTYSYDNGVDAIVEGNVGCYTDSEEDYIYLGALYYDSNHYSAEVQGTLQPISENTFSVADEISGSVELEVTFVNGGMDVKITAYESEEYKVLEGHYDLLYGFEDDEVD